MQRREHLEVRAGEGQEAVSQRLALSGPRRPRVACYRGAPQASFPGPGVGVPGLGPLFPHSFSVPSSSSSPSAAMDLPPKGSLPQGLTVCAHSPALPGPRPHRVRRLPANSGCPPLARPPRHLAARGPGLLSPRTWCPSSASLSPTLGTAG